MIVILSSEDRNMLQSMGIANDDAVWVLYAPERRTLSQLVDDQLRREESSNYSEAAE